MQGEGKSQVLEGDSKTWKLVTVHENRHRGIAPEFCLKFLQVQGLFINYSFRLFVHIFINFLFTFFFRVQYIMS